MSVPTECPTCASEGIKSFVRLYQINFEEAAVFCESPTCIYPYFSSNSCPTVVERPLSQIMGGPSSQAPTSVADIDVRSPTTSVMSWSSRASTLSSIESSATTPPPTISNHLYTLTSNGKSLIHNPQPFKFGPVITPEASVQNSPASSVFSSTDAEVDNLMGNIFGRNSALELTPSPSPSMDSTHNRIQDDFDAFLNSTFLPKEAVPNVEPFQKSAVTEALPPDRNKRKRIDTTPEAALKAAKKSIKETAPARNVPKVDLQYSEDGTAICTISYASVANNTSSQTTIVPEVKASKTKSAPPKRSLQSTAKSSQNGRKKAAPRSVALSSTPKGSHGSHLQSLLQKFYSKTIKNKASV